MSGFTLSSNVVGLKGFSPSVELLQWLAKGHLKQNLLRSIRLWVLISFLYGEAQSEQGLGDRFTFTDWRTVFFSATHPQGEEKPNLHDTNCACAKTASEWLFDHSAGVIESEWRQTFQQYSHSSDQELDDLLRCQPFAVTRRSLQADLQKLIELGWLQRQEQYYLRVSKLPDCPVVQRSEPQHHLGAHQLNFLAPDVAALVQSFPQEIRGIQRFFLHIDYIVAQDIIDRVEDWQERLCRIWADEEVLPVKLSYASSRLGQSLQCVIYPVCVYYAQRAVYLCAFGQTPTRQGEWYNYRLDRIQKMSPMQWSDPKVPKLLLQHYQKRSLPTPEYIEIEMTKAWGFDFYLPAQPMLIRFNRDFHDRYIQGTFRHDTFTKISYPAAKQLIQQQTSLSEGKALLQILQSRSPQDAYYRVDYRVGDTNVGQRLRAWRPNGEVLLPWRLRQAIAAEVKEEFDLYHIEGTS